MEEVVQDLGQVVQVGQGEQEVHDLVVQIEKNRVAEDCVNVLPFDPTHLANRHLAVEWRARPHLHPATSPTASASVAPLHHDRPHFRR